MTLSIIELISGVGEENTKVQALDSTITRFDRSAKNGTRLTFYTDQNFTIDGTQEMGLVIWLPRDKVAEILKGKE